MTIVNTGINDQHREQLAQKLSCVLANTYFLYLKTQNFHWNVTGPYFYNLHKLFEEQYEELADAVDEIAERIRALGSRAPASFKEFSSLTSIAESTEHLDWQTMVHQLQEDHEFIARDAREMLALVNEAQDEATLSLLDDRFTAHEKHAWMLRNLLI